MVKHDSRNTGGSRRAFRTSVRDVLGVLWCVVLGLVLVGAGIIVRQPAPARAAGLNAIQVENTYPGDPTWNNFQSAANDATLSGYASATSVNHGGSIDFYVTTTAATFTIDIYRTGWYSGVGARKILSMGSFTGVAQSIPTPDPTTGMIAATNWTKTTTLNVPSNWTTGMYLAKLSGSNGDASFIPFVVRDDGGHEDFVLQFPFATYEAYNTWGGTSLYENLTNGSIWKYGQATKVSFDRPFEPASYNGSGQYLAFDVSFVRWAEKNGFDISYTSDIDTHINYNPLTNHKAFISVGHDEYWSNQMRTVVQNAINSGVNAAFFGGNDMYWQIRLEANSASVANRVETCYKLDYADTGPPGPDPMYGVNNSLVTTNWRDPLINQPENAIMGEMYEDQEASNSPTTYVVQNASHWVYANTGFVNGSTVPGIVGYEYDNVVNNGKTPANLTVLSNSPVTGNTVGSSHSNTTIYTAASGARVFDAGTIQWSWGLDNFGNRTTANAGIQQMTANLMYNFNGGSPPPPPPSLPAGTYLQDGFESGNLTQWSGPWGTGTATTETTNVNSGQYAASMTAGTGQYTDLYAPLQGGGQALTYTRFYVYIPAGGPSQTLATGTDSSNNKLWSVTYDAGHQTLDMYVWNGAGARTDRYPAANLIKPGAWNAVEFEDNEATSGHAELWINGASAATVDGDLSATNHYSLMYLWEDGVGTVYYDDVKVSNAYNGLVPVSLSPASLSFGTVQVGTSSTAQTETLTNTGSTALNVSSVGLTGTNAGDFATSADTCSGQSLAAGANCTVSVTFSPTAGGARTASLTYTDNAGNSPQSIGLSGTGGAASVSLSATTLNFGTQNVGTTSSAKTVTLTNTGTWGLNVNGISIGGAAAGDYAQTNTCGSSVAAGANCTISVTFTPTTTGSRGATLSIADSVSGSPQQVQLGGASLAAGTYLQDDFESGNTALWTTGGNGQAAVEQTKVNSGQNALALTDASGQNVSLTDGLAGGGQALTYTRFYFQVPSGAPTTVIAQGLNANGQQVWVMVYDAGHQGIDIYAWNGAGTRFDLYTNSGVINTGTWYALEFEDNEASSGHAELWINGTSAVSIDGDLSTSTPNASLVLWNQAAGTVYFDDVKVGSHFNGLVPVGLSPASLNFGTVAVGTSSSAQTETLTNTGSSALNVSSVSVTGTNAGDFATSADTCSGQSLAAGASCTVAVTFTPTASGARTASLTYTDNAGNSPQSIGLSGTGGAPSVSFSATSLNFGTQNVGTTSAAKTVTLTNTGSMALSINSISLGGAAAGDYAQTNTCGSSVAVGANCTISVTFTPTATGSRGATLSIADNVSGSPQTVQLGGASLPAGTYLADDFESGNTALWSTGGNGSATVEQTTVHGGQNAVALTDASGQNVSLTAGLAGGGQALTYTQFYFQAPSGSQTTVIAQGLNANGQQVWVMVYDAGRQGIDIYAWNAAGTRYDLYTNGGVITTGAWYNLEFEINEATSGHAELWINGTSSASVDGDLSTSTPYASLVLWNQVTGTFYFDDVKVANAFM